MPIEQTFVMIKPDGVQREIIGEIISRFERKSLKLLALKMLILDREIAEKHYEEHKGRDFYEPLMDFITSGPVVASVWEGLNAISLVRNMVGATNPAEAIPGSIRGDYVICTTFNVVHASDSPETADREIGIYFNRAELVEYTLPIKKFRG